MTHTEQRDAGQGGGGRQLAILGGTGRSGRLLIDVALAAGYGLRVLARDPARLHRQDPRLVPVTGDARDPQAVATLLEGVDAVLSALGPVRGEARGDGSGVMTRAAENLVAAMSGAGVSRLISMTGAGVAQPGDQPKVFDRVIRTALRLSQPDVLRDSEGHVARLRESDLAWTVVRVPMLIDGPAQPVRAGRVGDIGPRVSRASVATFMLEQLDSDRWLRQAPAISH
ncbi:NAD(P)-dependent oxidoreductase [Deinococcus budaensis]|uniref:Putative NADH-flavin reductase n=1 Tax=Deinococcus budaensis TaxID=1665626 RepID=A0A7W8GDT8_9DEIO|nr:NAD(P)H-binding protein [Deinococcus budaensis]MBB5233730.1 putative NADH-flavin reductase [Deinococcus budaensis]